MRTSPGRIFPSNTRCASVATVSRVFFSVAIFNWSVPAGAAAAAAATFVAVDAVPATDEDPAAAEIEARDGSEKSARGAELAATGIAGGSAAGPSEGPGNSPGTSIGTSI